MKRNTELSLAILFIVGIVVTLTYIFLSFLSPAIAIWTIVVITVFTILIYEIYDINLERKK